MKDNYPIMDKPYVQLITEALADETVPAIKTVVKTFYNRTVGDAINNYREYRFTQIQDRFIQEEKLLSNEQVKDFYKNIDSTKLDLLYDLLDKARITAYDLQAKILSKLYGNFVRNSELDYHEKTFLSNINILNDEDLIYFYKLIKSNISDIDETKIKEIKFSFQVSNYTQYYIFEKLVRTGLIVDSTDIEEIAIPSNPNFKLKNKNFSIYNFTKEIYNFLDLILGEEDKA